MAAGFLTDFFGLGVARGSRAHGRRSLGRTTTRAAGRARPSDPMPFGTQSLCRGRFFVIKPLFFSSMGGRPRFAVDLFVAADDPCEAAVDPAVGPTVDLATQSSRPSASKRAGAAARVVELSVAGGGPGAATRTVASRAASPSPPFFVPCIFPFRRLNPKHFRWIPRPRTFFGRPRFLDAGAVLPARAPNSPALGAFEFSGARSS